MSAIWKVEPRPPGPGRDPSRAALRRVDARLRAFHEALLSLPVPDRLLPGRASAAGLADRPAAGTTPGREGR